MCPLARSWSNSASQVRACTDPHRPDRLGEGSHSPSWDITALHTLVSTPRPRWRSCLVFTTALGGPADPRNLPRVIEVAAMDAGVVDVGVHTLRHSAAVAWLESGVHIEAVADLLGHSSIAITGDVSGHTSDDTARAAVDALAGRLGL